MDAPVLLVIAGVVVGAFALGATHQRYRAAREYHIDSRRKLRAARRGRYMAGKTSVSAWLVGIVALIVVAAWLTGRAVPR